MNRKVIFGLLVLLCLSSVFALNLRKITDSFSYGIINTDREYIAFNAQNDVKGELVITLDVDKVYYDGRTVPIKLITANGNKTLFNIPVANFPIQKAFSWNTIRLNYPAIKLYKLKSFELHLGDDSASLLVSNETGYFFIENDFYNLTWGDDYGAMSYWATKQSGYDGDNRISPGIKTPSLADENAKGVFGSFGWQVDTISSRVNFGNVVTEIIANNIGNWERNVYVYKESPCMRYVDEWNTTHKIIYVPLYLDKDLVTNSVCGNGTRFPSGSGVYDYNNDELYCNAEEDTAFMLHQVNPIVETWTGTGANLLGHIKEQTSHFLSFTPRDNNALITKTNRHLCLPSTNTTDKATKLYYELQEKKGAVCTNTTGTCEIYSGIHFESVPTGEYSLFNQKGNTTNENNGYQYIKWGNSSAKVIGLYNSTTEIPGLTDIAWEITFDYDNDCWNFTDTSKIDCSVGQRVGNYRQGAIKDNNGCNQTIDVFGSPLVGTYVWYESYNTNETAYFVIDGDGNYSFPNAPTVENITINTTTPSFYETIRCSGVVNDADGANEILAVYANMTYANGTVITQQMTNTTSFDWATDFIKIDFEGVYNCNITVYDATDSGTNQTAGIMKSPLELSNTSNAVVGDFTNQTYSITFKDNEFTTHFNTSSMTFGDRVAWFDFNTSSVYTNYYTPYLISSNATSTPIKYNSTVNFINGTSHTNQTTGAQLIIFGFQLFAQNQTYANLTELSTNGYSFSVVDAGVSGNNSVYLSFNHTNYSTALSGGTYNRELTMFAVNESMFNATYLWFGWAQADNGTYTRNTTLSDKWTTIHKLYVGDCTNSSIKALSFTTYDEQNGTSYYKVNSSFNARVIINEPGNSRTYFVVHLNETDINTFDICITPPWASYEDVDLDIDIYTPSYSKRLHYLRSDTLDNTTAYENLFHLLAVNDDKLTFTIVDEADKPLEGYLVRVQRWFRPVYETVAMCQTDSLGVCFMYLQPELAWYEFSVLDNDGNIVFTDEVAHLVDVSAWKITIITEAIVKYWEYKDEVGSNYSFVGNTLHFRTTEPGTSVANITLSIFEISLGGNTEICYIVTTGNHAQCAMGNRTERIFMVDLFITFNNGDKFTVFSDILDYTTLDVTTWGTFGLTLAFIIVLTFSFVGIWSPAMGIVLCIGGIIASYALGFLVVTYEAIIILIVIGAVLVVKVRY